MTTTKTTSVWKPATIVFAAILALAATYWFASKSETPKQSFTATTAGASTTADQPQAAPTMPAHPIRGNRKSRIYHWYGCGSYDRISDKNIIEFATREEAEKAGYRAAKNC